MIADPYQRRYMETEHGKLVRAAYRSRPESKIAAVKAVQKYRQSERGKRVHGEYLMRPETVEARRARDREYAASPRGKVALAKKAFRRRLRLAGFTTELYERLLIEQAGACAVCGEVPPARKNGLSGLRPDHNHGTGKARGLLCNGCNLAAGHLRDLPARARALALYLEAWP